MNRRLYVNKSDPDNRMVEKDLKEMKLFITYTNNVIDV